MKCNFEFDGFSVVRWQDTFVDLHNAYDLKRFGTDLNGNQVELRFQRNRYAIDPKKLPATVALSCTGNVSVAFNDLCALAAPITDEGIDLAYFNDDCDWRSFLDEDLAQQRDPQGLHLNFVNGLAVRIYCDEVTFTAH